MREGLIILLKKWCTENTDGVPVEDIADAILADNWIDKLTKEIKGEVINEVKERLRANADIYNVNYPYGCSLKVINNITKEMAGDIE